MNYIYVNEISVCAWLDELLLLVEATYLNVNFYCNTVLYSD